MLTKVHRVVSSSVSGETTKALAHSMSDAIVEAVAEEKWVSATNAVNPLGWGLFQPIPRLFNAATEWLGFKRSSYPSCVMSAISRGFFSQTLVKQSVEDATLFNIVTEFAKDKSIRLDMAFSDEFECDLPAFLDTVSTVLMSTMALHADTQDIPASAFYAKRITHIPVRKYLDRIAHYWGMRGMNAEPVAANKTYYFSDSIENCVTPHHFILMLVFLRDYLLKQQGQDFLNPHNVHRLILVSFLLSSSLLDDENLRSDQKDIFHYYAKVGGLPSSELIQLQKEFAEKIEFDFFIKSDVFVSMARFLLPTLPVVIAEKEPELAYADVAVPLANKASPSRTA